MKNNDFKQADNSISSIKKSNSVSYDGIVEDIDKEKVYLKYIDDIRDKFLNINKNFNKCLDLLSISIRGNESSALIDEMLSDNMATISRVSDELDSEQEKTKNKINDLYYKKDNFDSIKRKEIEEKNKEKNKDNSI